MSIPSKSAKGYVRSPQFECKPLKEVLNKSSIKKKINIVFDLDMTLVQAVKLQSSKLPPDDTGEIIEVKLKKSDLYYSVRARPKIHKILDKLGRIAKLYIRTNSLQAYSLAIVSKIINVGKEYIKLKNVHGEQVIYKNFDESKSLSHMGLSSSNTIIIDDQVAVWKKEDRNNILLSLKYAPNLADESLNQRLRILFWCNNKMLMDEDWGIFEGEGSTNQLNFIKLFIQKCSQVYEERPRPISEIIAHQKALILRDMPCRIKAKKNCELMKEIVCGLGGKISESKESYSIGYHKADGAEYSSYFLMLSYLYLYKFDIDKFMLMEYDK